MRKEPESLQIYRHFKGSYYQIIAIAEDTETGNRIVVYQALYGDCKCYARDLEMFMSEVDRNKYPNADQVYRFELAEELGN